MGGEGAGGRRGGEQASSTSTDRSDWSAHQSPSDKKLLSAVDLLPTVVLFFRFCATLVLRKARAALFYIALGVKGRLRCAGRKSILFSPPLHCSRWKAGNAPGPPVHTLPSRWKSVYFPTLLYLCLEWRLEWRLPLALATSDHVRVCVWGPSSISIHQQELCGWENCPLAHGEQHIWINMLFFPPQQPSGPSAFETDARELEK